MNRRWTTAEVPCHLCGGDMLQTSDLQPHGVTSDSRPWTGNEALAVCRSCGQVQKPVNDFFRQNTAAIYASYRIYAQSGGREQRVFLAQGAVMPPARSEHLFRWIMDRFDPPAQARLLDFGCGNGQLLGSVSRLRPGWTLWGLDLNEAHRLDVTAISDVEGFATDLEELPEKSFDWIVMLHSLEHIPAPGETLKRLAGRMAPGGRLLIQVPAWKKNPFDLMVADHCTHFSAPSVLRFLETCGFKVEAFSDQVVPREITIVLTKDGPGITIDESPADVFVEMRTVERALDWLEACLAAIREFEGQGAIGILGTANGGGWLGGALGDLVGFFVDEDPSRVGCPFLGRPVVLPAETPTDAHILIGLPGPVAVAIAERLDPVGSRFIVPPRLDLSDHDPGEAQGDTP